MSSTHNLRDLQWLLQAFKSHTLNLHHISFYLSQPISACHQETEDSININISRDTNSHFTLLHTAFTTSKHTQTSLRNLEFHHVEWDPQLLRNLGRLLEHGSNLKQLVLRRNRLSTECLFEFAEILKGNEVIKEVMVLESVIGSLELSLLASALQVNNSLEELEIWEDSIGSKGAEELSKMIEANSTLKLLTICDSHSITATPLISAVLARSRSMEVHVWSGEHREKSSKVVDFAPENSTLRMSQHIWCLQGCLRIGFKFHGEVPRHVLSMYVVPVLFYRASIYLVKDKMTIH